MSRSLINFAKYAWTLALAHGGRAPPDYGKTAHQVQNGRRTCQRGTGGGTEPPSKFERKVPRVQGEGHLDAQRKSRAALPGGAWKYRAERTPICKVLVEASRNSKKCEWRSKGKLSCGIKRSCSDTERTAERWTSRVKHPKSGRGNLCTRRLRSKI